MLISKELEGATVERVYWAVPSREWLPVIGEQFDSFREAVDHADKQMVEQDARTATVVSRMVFQRTDGVIVDMEVGLERRFR